MKRSKSVTLLLPLTASVAACSQEPAVTNVPIKQASKPCSTLSADIERCKGTNTPVHGGTAFIHVGGYHGNYGYVPPRSFGAVPNAPATSTFTPTSSFRAAAVSARGGFGAGGAAHGASAAG